MNCRAFIKRNGLWLTGAVAFPAIVRSQVLPSARRIASPTPASSGSSLLTGLAAYWKLNESSDGTSQVDRTEISGSGQTLTDNSPFAASATGKISNAVQFVAANAEYLSRADSSTLSVGTGVSFTIGCWVYFDTISVDRYFISKWNSTTANQEFAVRFQQSSSRIRAAVCDGTTAAGVNADDLGAPSINTWYYVLFGWTAGNVFIQVNNGTVNTAAHTNGAQNGTNAFEVGAFSGGSVYFDGRVDEVGFWKRALTVSEKTALYNSAAGLTYPF